MDRVEREVARTPFSKPAMSSFNASNTPSTRSNFPPPVFLKESKFQSRSVGLLIAVLLFKSPSLERALYRISTLLIERPCQVISSPSSRNGKINLPAHSPVRQ